MNTEQVVIQVAPEGLLADSNIRFSLKRHRVEALAEDIKNAGGIQVPLNVEELAEPGPNGELYVIREGHYRQAAALLLEKQGVEITCPCLVVDALEGTERLSRQVAENVMREEFSPMDIANAAKEYLDAGMSKVQIREKFPVNGGRGGTELRPMSNSYLNIFLSFLDFPKPIQTKIHNGVLGVADAYKLTLKPKELWQQILDKAEADRSAKIEEEEKLETKYLEDQKKAAEAEAKLKADVEALEKAQLAIEEREKAKEEAVNKAAEYYRKASATPSKDKDAKKKAEEAHKAADNDAKIKQKLLDEAQSEAAKLQEKIDRAAKQAAERAEKLKAQREEAARKAKLDIDKAAQKVTGTGSVALTATEMRKLIADNSLGSSFPKTQKVFQAIGRAMAGTITDTQVLSEVAWIVGERDKPKHVKDVKPAKKEKAEAAAE